MIRLAAAHLIFLIWKLLQFPNKNRNILRKVEENLSIAQPARGPDLLDAGAVHEVLHLQQMQSGYC